MPDLFEGHQPRKAIAREADESSGELAKGKFGKMKLGTSAKKRAMDLWTDSEARRHKTYVSCWHLSHVESYAMWRLYAQEGNGIAIGSTVGALKRSVKFDGELSIGRVLYTQFDEDDQYHVGLASAFRKRLSFEHDREIRIAFEHPYNGGITFGGRVLLAVDLKDLIERMRLAPGTSGEVAKAMASLLARYDLQPQLLSASMLDKEPGY